MTTTVNDKTKSPLRLPQKVVVCRELGLPAAYLLDFCAGAGRGIFSEPISTVNAISKMQCFA